MRFVKNRNFSTISKIKSISKIGIILLLFSVISQNKLFAQGSNDTPSYEDTSALDRKPLFKGKYSISEFRKYITENLKYPKICAENNISGQVIVSFVVNQKGKVTNVKVIKGVDPALDREARRVVKSSPKWTPGIKDDKPVKVAYTLPIVFILE